MGTLPPFAPTPATKICDVGLCGQWHSKEGTIAPPGHSLHTFREEPGLISTTEVTLRVPDTNSFTKRVVRNGMSGLKYRMTCDGLEMMAFRGLPLDSTTT